jgi:hypothetical protein
MKLFVTMLLSNVYTAVAKLSSLVPWEDVAFLCGHITNADRWDFQISRCTESESNVFANSSWSFILHIRSCRTVNGLNFMSDDAIISESMIICSEMPHLLSHPYSKEQNTYNWEKPDRIIVTQRDLSLSRNDSRRQDSCGVKFGKRRMCQHKLCFAFALFLNGRQTDTYIARASPAHAEFWSW